MGTPDKRQQFSFCLRLRYVSSWEIYLALQISQNIFPVIDDIVSLRKPQLFFQLYHIKFRMTEIPTNSEAAFLIVCENSSYRNRFYEIVHPTCNQPGKYKLHQMVMNGIRLDIPTMDKDSMLKIQLLIPVLQYQTDETWISALHYLSSPIFIFAVFLLADAPCMSTKLPW